MGTSIPYDIDAEKAVLSCMIIDNGAAQLGCQLIVSEDFYSHQNRAVFDAIKDVLKLDSTIDIITLKNNLEDKNVFEKIGGLNYLAEIATSCGSSIALKNYITIVRELSEKRKAIAIAQEIIRAAKEENYTTMLDVIDSLKSQVVRADDDILPLPEILDKSLEKAFENIKSGKRFTGNITGFTDFDLLTGGLQNGDLIIIAGRPSMGKTAFALDVARGMCGQLKDNNKMVAIFSLEMTKEKLTHRITSAEMKISNEKFKLTTFSSDDIRRMAEDAKEFENKFANVYIDDTSAIGTKDVYTKCHKLKAQHGQDIGLIVVDYLQLMVGKGNTRENEVSGMSREMKAIARKFNCPVILLSQLSRECEKRADRRPMLSDLRESGAIEQDADVVAFLYRDEYYFPDTEKKGIAELIIAKQRDGAVGTVKLNFLNNLTSFRNLERYR